MRRLAAALALMAAAPAVGQSVSDCDWRSDMRLIAEPWESATRTFAKGAVRLVLLDTIEPAMTPFQLLVLSPPHDELGARQCKVVHGDHGLGFYDMDMGALEAGYDPAVGLMFSLPVAIWGEGHEAPAPATLQFSLNQATGAIAARLGIAGR